MIVANPKNIDLGALAVLKLEEQGMSMKLEPSSENSVGSRTASGAMRRAHAPSCSRRRTPARSNSRQAWTWSTIPKFPLAERVGAQLATLQAVIAAYNDEAAPGARVEVANLPSMADIERDGLGKYLR